MTKEVVITGLGVVSPLGNTHEELFENLIAGQSGIAKIERFDVTDFPVQFGGEVRKFDATPYLHPKEIKRTSRYVQYMVHAAAMAVKDAGIEKDSIDINRAGVVVGSGMGGIECFTDNAVALVNRGPGRMSPFFIPMAITNMGAGFVGINLGWRGPNWSVTSACATGNHAIIDAMNTILLGKADVMVAGGAEESVCPTAVGGFARMKALSRRNDAPAQASRPYDVDRDGFVIGEGAGAVVLESREHAEARGAKILGVVKGYGASCDAYHMSTPLESGEGVALAINEAIRDAGISKEDIGLINGHSTSTPLGDIAEFKAIKRAFGSHIQDMQLHSTKSLIGHSLGGASAIEAVVLVKTLNSGKVHPSINVDNQDPGIDMNVVPNKAQETKTEFGISNSFGFGGHNSCLIIQKG